MQIMKSRYYYFISSLNDLEFENSISLNEIEVFIEEAKLCLTNNDYETLKAIFFEYDENNLINVLLKEHNKYDIRGTSNEEDFNLSLKEGFGLAPYIHEVAETSYKNDKLITKSILIKKRYEYLIQHPHDYIKKWHQFELDLNNVLTLLNCKNSHELLTDLGIPIDINSHIYEVGDVNILDIDKLEELYKTTDYEGFNDILNIHSSSIKDIKSIIKKIKWNYSESLIKNGPFSLDELLSYAIKLKLNFSDSININIENLVHIELKSVS